MKEKMELIKNWCRRNEQEITVTAGMLGMGIFGYMLGCIGTENKMYSVILNQMIGVSKK